MQPKIYSFKEHRIDHKQIDSDALWVLDKLIAGGFQAFLVGGGVRDILAGVEPKDFDISTSAKPEEIKKIFQRKCILIGRRFRLAHIRFGRKIIEVSTFRAGDNEQNDLITHDNTWGTPEQDVLRRDFTINGLFYNPVDQSIIDYVGGCQDIQNHLMRTIGDARVRFRQDPVRMLRLIKFKARFAYQVDPDAYEAMLQCRDEITKSAPARILEETLKMLESGSATQFFRLLTETAFTDLLFPQLASFLRSENGDMVYQLLEKIDELHRQRRRPMDRSILCACLFFPILKISIDDHIQKNDTPHLGQVSEICHSVLRDLMNDSFCHFPKRLKALVTSILITQYRLIPLNKTKSAKSHWLLKSKDIRPSLTFLGIRSKVTPSLSEAYAKWHDLYLKHASKQPPTNYSRPAKRPRRRRARR